MLYIRGQLLVVSPGEEIAISGGEEGGRETQTIHLVRICTNTNLKLTHHVAPTAPRASINQSLCMDKSCTVVEKRIVVVRKLNMGFYPSAS